MAGIASEITDRHVEREALAMFRELAPWLESLDPAELVGFLSLAGTGPVPSDIALDAAVAADRLQAWAEAQKARAVARVLDAARRPDDPCHTVHPDMQRRAVVSEIACALTIPEGTAGALCDRSEALAATFTETLRALERGQISWNRAMVILDHADGLEPEVLAEYEAAALASAPSLTRAKLARKCHRLREKLHGQPLAKRRRTAMERRDVTLEPGRDAMAWISAYLPADTAVAAYNRITAAALSLQAPDEPRTLPQLRADVLSDILLSAGALVGANGGLPAQADFRLDAEQSSAGQSPAGQSPAGQSPAGQSPAGQSHPKRSNPEQSPAGDPSGARGPLRAAWSGIRPQVSVTIPVLTALGGGLPAELEGYGPIPPDVARSLAGSAPSWSRLLTEPESGTVVSVGRRSYGVPPDLRRYLQQRDLTCRFPGCGRAVRFCDVDHTKAWHDGGGTDFNNLAHLCPKHHAIKHSTDWKVRTVAAGLLEWTSPTGRRYTSAAEGFAEPSVIPTSRSDPGSSKISRDTAPAGNENSDPPPF